jgi:hypothetical protein
LLIAKNIRPDKKGARSIRPTGRWQPAVSAAECEKSLTTFKTVGQRTRLKRKQLEQCSEPTTPRRIAGKPFVSPDADRIEGLSASAFKRLFKPAEAKSRTLNGLAWLSESAGSFRRKLIPN